MVCKIWRRKEEREINTKINIYNYVFFLFCCNNKRNILCQKVPIGYTVLQDLKNADPIKTVR